MDPNTQAPAPEPQQPTEPTSGPMPQQQPEAPSAQTPQQFVPQVPQMVPQPVAAAPVDPYQTPQPFVSEQPMGAATPQRDPGHGLGVAALVTSLVGLPLLGVIFGIIAIRKSKKAGFRGNGLGLAGLIIGLVFFILVIPVLVALVLTNLQTAQAKARDTVAVTRLNATHSKLEEYHNVNAAYPKIISATNLPGIDSAALTDPTGMEIVISDGAAISISEALETDLPDTSTRYQYIPFDCGDIYCLGYVLRAYIERPSSVTKNPYVKLGLNNP